VLAVDDDDEIRELVRLILAESGYEVATAADGRAALDVARSFDPALILLDMRMPVMDGWEFARAYRGVPGKRAQVVVLTAARDARARADAVGADGWLAKPFDIVDLLSAVRARVG